MRLRLRVRSAQFRNGPDHIRWPAPLGPADDGIAVALRGRAQDACLTSDRLSSAIEWMDAKHLALKVMRYRQQKSAAVHVAERVGRPHWNQLDRFC